MEKDAIFKQRKQLKKQGHQMVRKNYAILAFLVLILALFGTEFGLSLSKSGLGKNTLEEADMQDADDDVQTDTAIFSDDVSGSRQVWQNLFQALLPNQAKRAEEIGAVLSQKFDESEALGRTNGILAGLVNNLSSGKILVRLAQSLTTITNSDKLAMMLCVAGAFLLYMLNFIFFRNILSAAVRRVFLEAGTYSNVRLPDVVHFAAVHRWINASMVMLLKEIYLTLWSLTIAGGFIKTFSYFAVPYIVAENPAVPARKAIALSRRMMYGHKWELLKLQLTMIGWTVLGVLTFGFSDLLYGGAYKLAVSSRFYACVRKDALERKLEGTELLNDPYLFEKADRILLYENYFDVVDEITLLHENRITLSGWRKKVSDWFALWFGTLAQKKAYDEQEGRSYAIEWHRKSMLGEAYPQLLNPLWSESESRKQGGVAFMRNYTLWTVFLMFIAFSFVGWVWEVALHLMQTGQFANRGTLHGPWLPIYGAGGVIVLILCSRFRKKPVVEFIIATALCGVIEYFSAWLLETRFNEKWWSYDGYFLNLHGRICAEGLLVFGVGCCAVVYLLAPIFDHFLTRFNTKVLIGICLALALAFGSDFVYSQMHPNMAEGAVESQVIEEETESEYIPETSAVNALS